MERKKKPPNPEPTERLILEVPKTSNLDEVLRLIAKALESRNTGGGDNSAVLTAINNLSGKVDKFMATQEERLKVIQGQLTSIADGINTLQQQLADLKANNPNLDDEISAIETTVKDMANDLNPPTPEPPPEG